MLKWIRSKLFGQRNFTRAWKEAVEEQYDQGKITQAEYLNCIKAAEHPETMQKARKQLIADPNMLGGIGDWDWEAIYEWFVTYFVPAMKVIIPIFLMLLKENPTPND